MQNEDGSKLRRRTHLPRDPQGIVRLQWLENFFETLYSSNQRINIPYTVVFQYRRIYAAYFTDSEGFVQKIDKIADLGPDQVMEGLKSSSSKVSMPRAYYIYAKKSDDVFTTDQNQDLSIEYFDDVSLAHFLTYRSKENNGILQQFLEPATLNVSSIRAYWTPYFCQLETRMNVHRADDVHIPIQRRAVTFEGEHHHSQPFPLSSKLEGRVEERIRVIVQNVKHVLPSNVGIQIMMLNFKVGAAGKIWFLYCNSIKLYDQSQSSLGNGREPLGTRPGSARLVEASIPPPGYRGSKKRHGLVCPSTETRLGPYDRYKVSVQQIFSHFLWHGPTKGWMKFNRPPPTIDLEFGQDPDPSGVLGNHLRTLLTMDLRQSPQGLPFYWNAPLDKASLKERDIARWSSECKEAHSRLEKKLDGLLNQNHDLKSMYRFWETTMVYLISQEIESLTIENFQQERIRPGFLQSELHCCENALLVYNATYEEILEEQRKLLYKPLTGDCISWSRLGAIPHQGSKREYFIPRKRPESSTKNGNKNFRTGAGSSQGHDVLYGEDPFAEGAAIASFNRKLQNEKFPLSRLTRKMIVSALGVASDSETPLQHDRTAGFSTHREVGSRTPRDLPLKINTLLPTLVMTENLVKQLEAWNRA